MNAQVVLLYQQGDYEQALRLAEQAYYLSQQAYDSDYLDVVNALNNLALIYQSVGNLDRANLLQ